MKVFRRAAIIQLRVIGALMLRELLVEGTERSFPFLGIVIRPVVMILAFYLLGRAASTFAPAGIPLLIFVVTGFLTWDVFLRTFIGISISSQAGLLLIPHVTPLDLMLSRAAVKIFLYTVLFLLLCSVGMLFEGAAPPANPLGVVLAFWSALGLGTGLGLIVCSIRRFTALFDDLFTGIRIVGHALSGVFALATATPTPILNWLKWNPLFHSVEWLRQSWWAGYKSPIASPAYVYTWIFFLLAAGLAFERASRKHQGE